MKSSRVWRSCSFATAGVLLVAGCMLAGHVSAQTGKVASAASSGRLFGRGVRIPMEYDSEGRTKSEAYAETATLPDASGEVKAEKVRMVLAEDGIDAKSTVVTTDACRISPSNRTAKSNSPARLEQTGLVITGNGFRWHGSREHIRIMSDARVVITRSFVDQRQGKSSSPPVLPGFQKTGY